MSRSARHGYPPRAYHICVAAHSLWSGSEVAAAVFLDGVLTGEELTPVAAMPLVIARIGVSSRGALLCIFFKGVYLFDFATPEGLLGEPLLADPLVDS